MLLALACLSLLATWFITQRLATEGETLRLTLFLVSSIVYFAAAIAVFYRTQLKCSPPLGLTLQFLSLGVMIYAAGSDGPLWLLTLPLACQVVLYLPARVVWPALGIVLAIACLPLTNLHSSQILYGALNVFSSFFFTVGCSWAMRRERDTRAQLEAAHEQLRIHADQIEALTVAEERNRLAREIHDGAAHHLTAANVLLEAGQALLPPGLPDTVRNPLRKAQGQIRAALVELRESIESRHVRSATARLPERIRALVAEGGFPAQLEVSGISRPLRAEAEQALFRVAQEALTNARKHAPGAAIVLRLDYTDARRTTLRVANSKTSGSESGDGAVGLLSLHQRMRELGGIFRAEMEASGQFVVQAEVPA